MDSASHDFAEKAARRAQAELEEGRVLAALASLEASLQAEDDPRLYSRLGFCIAKERGHVSRGLELCRSAIEREPDEPVHYLFLGKVQLLAGDKAEALRIFRQAMARWGSSDIQQMLDSMGIRMPPPLPFLRRSHPLNKYLGKLQKLVGVRK